MEDKYGIQGDLQTELTEKIKIDLECLSNGKVNIYAGDMCQLLSIASEEGSCN